MNVDVILQKEIDAGDWRTMEIIPAVLVFSGEGFPIVAKIKEAPKRSFKKLAAAGWYKIQIAADDSVILEISPQFFQEGDVISF